MNNCWLDIVSSYRINAKTIHDGGVHVANVLDCDIVVDEFEL